MNQIKFENKRRIIRKNNGTNFFYQTFFFDEKSEFIKKFPKRTEVEKQIEKDIVNFIPFVYKLSWIEFRYNANLNYLNVKYKSENVSTI